ncbi:MAG: hypothetical protein CMI52_03010 [Parcubacteria group bacterium]|nr:hypothetical protein [Parcubacteria group bacterium]
MIDNYLQSHGIPFVRHEHPAVFTCEDAREHCGDIPGIACKNLLLKGKKSKKFFLLILPAETRTDLKAFGEIINERVSFASPEALKELLDLEPGAVSPFGLLNDSEKKVSVYIDRELYDADIVGFHPNVNTATIELSHIAFLNFLDSLDHDIHLVDF